MNYELENFKEKLNLDDLFKRKREVEQNKIKVYQTILNRIHKKIKITSRQKHNDLFTFFIIPEFLVGTPVYDVAACTSYIIDKLTQNGFQIRYTHPNMLFICWKKWIPHYQRAEYKKKTGISINGFGRVITEEEKKAIKAKAATTTSTIVKKNNFIKINTYKPTGTLIYDKNLLNKIQEKTIKLK